MSDDSYKRYGGSNNEQLSEQKPFKVHISDEDYASETAYSNPRNPRQQGRSSGRSGGYYNGGRRGDNNYAMQPTGAPISRTRIVTSNSGEKYEIADEGTLSSRYLSKTKKNQKSRGCLISVVYAIIICSISALLAFYLIVGINDMFGLVKEDMVIVVNVPENADLETITKLLDDNGVVDYPFFFKMYASFTNKKEFKAGEFSLNSKSDYDMIIRKLTRPASASDDGLVKVTIPEGFNVDQIARRLDDYCVCDYDKFYQTLQEYPFKHEFLKSLPENPEGRVNRLEGYLFPDTYYFYLSEGSVSAINKMLNNFNSRVMENNSLSFSAHAANLGRSMNDIIVIASIIERETPDKDEMPKVASVFYNRLNNKSYEGIGGRLQSDATKWYPFETKNAMLAADTYLGKPFTDSDKANWQSNYDTTVIAGLPPGAICCPGINSIRAALNPADTDYFYFFTDDNGAHYYAKTYDSMQSKLNECRANGLYSG